MQNGWRDASYSAKVDWQAGNYGADGGKVVCADLKAGSALAGGWEACTDACAALRRLSD